LLPTENGRDARSTTQWFSGIANLGRRPTFSKRSHQQILEVHLLDFNRDIYGQEIEVIFVSKLRNEQKFESISALKTQIASDSVAARKLTGTCRQL